MAMQLAVYQFTKLKYNLKLLAIDQNIKIQIVQSHTHSCTHIRTHTHTFNSPLSGTTWVRRYNTIQYNTKFVKRHVAVASEALANRSVKKQRRRRTNVL